MSAEYTDSSWIFQHICVLPQYRLSIIPKLVSLANTYAGLINKDVNNAMIFYQSHTRWARKSFERFKKSIGNKDAIDIYPMAYLYYDLRKPLQEAGPFANEISVEVVDSKEDIDKIFGKLAESVSRLYLDSFGLNIQEWDLQKIKSHYSKHGLTRDRVYIAVKNADHDVVAFAFCDISSRGISFSNFFDHFQIFKMSNQLTYNAVIKLINKIIQIYKKAGRDDIFCLCNDQALTDMLQVLGFVYLKIYNGCIFNRSNDNFDKFFDYLAHNRKETDDFLSYGINDIMPTKERNRKERNVLCQKSLFSKRQST